MQGDNLIAWREDLFQDNTTNNNNGRQNNELPPTLIIVNPGDTELPSQTPLPRGMSTRAQQAIANQRTAASAPPPPPPGGDIEMRGAAIGNIRADTTARALLAGTSQAPRNAATTDSQMPALSIVDGGEVSPRLPSGGSSQPSSPRSHQASPNTRGGGGGRAVVDPLANVPVDIDEEEMPESELQTM